MAVIYLTGAPASGKSSTINSMLALSSEIHHFQYGEELLRQVNSRGAKLQDQAQIRRESAGAVSPEDVVALDDRLLKFVDENRAEKTIIVDSHPVTKEDFGFRITSFNTEQVVALNPDQIWVFYTAPEITLSRIKSDAQGRPLVSLEEARFHTYLQSSIASQYAIAASCPVYLFDTNCEPAKLVKSLIERLERIT